MAFWWLLDLTQAGARACGLLVFEGVLGKIEFWVDGERRERPVYDIENLLKALPPPLKTETTVNGGGRPEVEEGLDTWRRWAALLPPDRVEPVGRWHWTNPEVWQNHRFPGGMSWRERMRPADPTKMLDALAAWRGWVREWRRGRREGG